MHSLFVSEPELKWCASLINDVGADQEIRLSDSQARTVLMGTTNMSAERITVAVNVLRRQGRI